MDLAERILRAGLETPDRLAMSIVGLSRADRWSHARLHETVAARRTASPPDTFRATPDGVIDWLASGHDMPPSQRSPALSAQDRVMLSQGTASFLPLALAAWGSGAAIIVPDPTITTQQWPLLGARHGATVLVATAAHLHDMFARDWKPWDGLRLGIVAEGPTGALEQLWAARTGAALTGLAPQPQTGQ